MPRRYCASLVSSACMWFGDDILNTCWILLTDNSCCTNRLHAKIGSRILGISLYDFKVNFTVKRMVSYPRAHLTSVGYCSTYSLAFQVQRGCLALSRESSRIKCTPTLSENTMETKAWVTILTCGSEISVFFLCCQLYREFLKVYWFVLRSRGRAIQPHQLAERLLADREKIYEPNSFTTQSIGSCFVVPPIHVYELFYSNVASSPCCVELFLFSFKCDVLQLTQEDY